MRPIDPADEEARAIELLTQARRDRLRAKRVEVPDPWERPRPIATPQPPAVTLADMVLAQAEMANGDAQPGATASGPSLTEAANDGWDVDVKRDGPP